MFTTKNSIYALAAVAGMGLGNTNTAGASPLDSASLTGADNNTQLVDRDAVKTVHKGLARSTSQELKHLMENIINAKSPEQADVEFRRLLASSEIALPLRDFARSKGLEKVFPAGVSALALLASGTQPELSSKEVEEVGKIAYLASQSGSEKSLPIESLRLLGVAILMIAALEGVKEFKLSKTGTIASGAVITGIGISIVCSSHLMSLGETELQKTGREIAAIVMHDTPGQAQK
jgi:hypothetical protein